MFTHPCKLHSFRISSVLLIVLCLFSTASRSQDEGGGAPSPTTTTIQPGINSPSIDQALVPEGVFVEQLAESLKLGPVTDEAKAEELLSRLGIEPKNGWIAEYPVTPDVLGDIENGVSKASDQGKIVLRKEDALKLIGDVKAKLGFDVAPGSKVPVGLTEKPTNKIIYTYSDNKGEIHITDNLDSIPKQYRARVKVRSPLNRNGAGKNAEDDETTGAGLQHMANPDPDDVDDYYYGQGPPTVTYYTPPAPYSYLYSWVPYPFWSTGFYFPGFFVLNNFHRHVVFNRHPYFVSHHNGGFTQPTGHLGPANRSLPGHFVPSWPTRWHPSPNALQGASAIVSFNKNHHQLANTSVTPQMGMDNGLLHSHHGLGINHPINSPAMGSFNSPTTFGHGQGFRPHHAFGNDNFGRFHNVGAMGGYHGGNMTSHRTYEPSVSRMYSRPSNFVNGRVYSSPYSHYGGSVQGGFHHAGGFGGFQGGGNFMGHQGGFFGGGAGGSRHR